MVTVRKSKLILPVLLILLIVLTAAACPRAASRLVADQADVFTDDQESQLAQRAESLGAEYDMDIVIVTTKDAEGKSAMAYADDYFDYNGYGVGTERNGILMLIDFDNRDVWISTSGSGIQYLTDARIESILDDIMAAGLSSGNNYGAAQAFLTSTADYLKAGIPHNTFTAFDGILGLAASGIMGISFYAGTKRIYRGTPHRAVFEYQKNSFVNLGIVTDNLVNSYVTSRPIPRATGGGRGGSSTHTSSSGRTHGGGGRGF